MASAVIRAAERTLKEEANKRLGRERQEELKLIYWTLRDLIGPLSSMGLDHRNGPHGELLDAAFRSMHLCREQLRPVIQHYDLPHERPKEQPRLCLFES